MARASFGGGVADFVVDVTADSGSPLRFAAATLTMWTAETGGTQITDLLVDGVAATTVPVDTDGQIPTFQGPSGVVVMWAQAGAGARVMIDAAGDIAILAQSAAADAQAAAASVPGMWQPTTAYTAGSVKVAPDGSTLSRIANGTSRATFDSTEKALWEPVISKTGTIDKAALDASIDARAVVPLPHVRAAQPVVCFTFDDCPVEDTTAVKPILDTYGVKGGFAFPSAYPGLAGLMSWAQIKTLYDAGHEVIAHSVDHSHLTGLTTAQKITQINNRATYESHGLSVRGFAYPFGEHDASLRKIVRDYYDYGLGTVTNASGSEAPLRTYGIRRIALKDSTLTADHYAQIDTAITNGEILVFIIHANPTAAEFTSAGGGYTRLANVIAYAQSHSVPVLTPSQAFDLVKNTLDTGDYIGGTDYTVIDGKGKPYATGLSAPEYKSYGDPFALTAATLPDTYPAGVTLISDIASTITDWPNGANVGMVLTDTVHAATSRAFVNQLYVSNGLMWHRRAQSGSNVWNSWTQIGPASPAPGSVTTIAAAPSTYAAGVTIATLLSPSTGSPRPGTGPGTVETVIAVPGSSGITTGSLNFQRFTSSGGTYVRQGTNDNTGWGGWYEIPRSQVAIAAVRDFPSIAAGGQQELTVACVGAVGDTVLLGAPAALEAGLIATARVTATNTVTIRLSNITASAIDPASASWTVRVLATPV